MKCSVHSTVPFAFYCFDDKTFLCGKCFKDHKKHKLEIKEDLMLKASLYSQSGSKTTVNLLDKYNQFIKNYNYKTAFFKTRNRPRNSRSLKKYR